MSTLDNVIAALESQKEDLRAQLETVTRERDEALAANKREHEKRRWAEDEGNGLLDRLNAAQADAAALRSALEANGIQHRDGDWCIGRCPVSSHDPECLQGRKALSSSSSAGKPVLEALEACEKAIVELNHATMLPDDCGGEIDRARIIGADALLRLAALGVGGK